MTQGFKVDPMGCCSAQTSAVLLSTLAVLIGVETFVVAIARRCTSCARVRTSTWSERYATASQLLPQEPCSCGNACYSVQVGPTTAIDPTPVVLVFCTKCLKAGQPVRDCHKQYEWAIGTEPLRGLSVTIEITDPPPTFVWRRTDVAGRERSYPPVRDELPLTDHDRRLLKSWRIEA